MSTESAGLDPLSANRSGTFGFPRLATLLRLSDVMSLTL